MHLRLSRFVALGPERMDAMVAEFRGSDYVDQLAGYPGFAGYMLALDYGNGKLTAMSFWQSREEMGVTDELAEAARVARIAESRPARHPFVDRYEVVIHREMERLAGHLRLSRLEGVSTEALDAIVEAFRQSDYLDQLAALAGFCGYVLAVDRDEGKLTAMSVWETHDALLASDRLAETARDLRVAAARTPHEPIIDRSEIVLAREGLGVR